MTEPLEKAPDTRSGKARLNGSIPKPKPDVEVGVSAYLPFVVPFKALWEALREEELTVKQFVAMRNSDGQARALFRLITLPIRSALKTATFVPEEYVDGGEEEAAFIEQMFTLPYSGGGMQVPFGRFVAQMLMAVFDGFSAFELVYDTAKTGPLKGKVILKKAAHRPAETLTFPLNDRSEFAGFRQRTMYMGQHVDVEIPAKDAIYYAANEEERPFYGQSYFHAAWKHWDKKYRLEVIAHIAAQRAAVGTRVGKMPQNPGLEERRKFERALADLGVFQSITIPENYSIESLKEAPGFPFLDYINYHNNQMSKSILAAFFDKDTGGGEPKLVDFGQQSDALFMMMLSTIMSEIEDVINQQVIPRFIDWNFGSGKYPKFQFGPLTDKTKDAVFELFKTLAVGGQSLTIRPEFVHELEKQVAEEIGLEIDWETVETLMEEEKEREEEMQQMQSLGSMDAAVPPGDGGVVGGPVQVNPDVIPDGFTLSHTDDAYLTLTEFAADLLDEAYQTVELVRGKPNSGEPKRVRTMEGARVYGVPIGTPITRDMEDRLAKEGVKGKPFGGGIRDPHGKQNRETLGGGPGAKAQNPGGVVTAPHKQRGDEPKRTFSHPKAPGVELLEYADGSVALRDAKGNVSARQKWSIEAFLKLGWTVDGPAAGDDTDEARTGSKTKPKRGDNTDDKAVAKARKVR